MNDIVNLNKARKQRKKAKKQAKSVQNRVKFGRKKSERSIEQANKSRLADRLDGKKLDPGDN